MTGTEEEQNYVVLYKMAKLGFLPSKAQEMDMDMVHAFIHLQAAEEKQYWETWIKLFSKMFGGK